MLKQNNLKVLILLGEDTDSPFEDSVYEFLTSFGFEVHKQVGCAGFRIDLAVVRSKITGKYLIGIECDGAMYHSSPVARDRDRLRQQVLEGFGWKIYRIWSTEWFQNRAHSIKGVLKAIEESKNPTIISKETEETKKSDELNISSEIANPEILDRPQINQDRGNECESPFEQSVYDLLTSCAGYEIHKQVGCAGYRIDLAVVDPISPGNYLIGIECDGAEYHSSSIDRDKDRLRQQELEDLG